MFFIAKPSIKAIIHQSIRRSAFSTKTARSDEKKKSNSSTYSFVVNVFRGKVEDTQVFPYPNVLNAEQKETIQMLIDPVTKFFTEINNAAKSDAEAKTDEKYLTAAWDLGLFGLQVPENLGGLGLTNTQVARLIQISSSYDLGLAITLGAHQSIGFKGILLFGTPEQKQKYLPRVTKNEYAAFCLTEPSAGSDAASIKTKAILDKAGEHYLLNGAKIWISNGGIAEIMTVFAKTPIKQAESNKIVEKMTAFIVERSFGGVTSGPPEQKMGIKSSNTTEVFFENVKVPIGNVLGNVGDGFKVAMNILNNGRFGMAAGMAGTMRHCIQESVKFATQRQQFGHTINSFETIQEKIARMAMLQYVTESMAYMISGNMDKGSKDYHVEAAISKCFGSEAAWYVCDQAIQIMGGMGYMQDAGLERYMRDLRIFRIFEGTNEILRLFVALTGIQHAGAHLKEIHKALSDPLANFGLLFSYSMRKVTRTFHLAPLPQIAPFVAPELATSALLLSSTIENFARKVELVLITYGKDIIDKQFILNRVADSAIDIYASIVVLSRATRSMKEKLPSAAHEKLMTEAWVLESCNRVENNLNFITKKTYLHNFEKMKEISKNVCDTLGVVQLSPIGL